MFSVGYDLGSSSVKASLLDSNVNKVLATVSYPKDEMPIFCDNEGWAEQSPLHWWENIKCATDLLFKKTPVARSKISAIGIAYQMHGLVVLDRNGEVLRPSIIWCDSRAVEIGEVGFEELGKDRCCNELLNSPANFTASKLKWVKDNEPSLYERIDKIMLPGDFIAFKFSNKITTTSMGLSEAILWDFKRNQLSHLIMNYYGFSYDLIPEIIPTFTKKLKVDKEIAKEFGFNPDVLISYRAGDQPNNAFSLGVLDPGEIAATAGTSGVVYGVVDKDIYDVQNRVNVFTHINYTSLQKRLGLLLCVNGTGCAYRWLRDLLAKGTQYQDLEYLASSIPIGCEGLTFLPFGNGVERMLGDLSSGASFKKIQFNRHSFDHMIRACIEGVAYSLVYGIRYIKSLGLNPSRIKVGNDNMFQSTIFSQTIATLTNSEIEVRDSTGSVGAARGAFYGWNGSTIDDLSSVDDKIEKTYTVDERNRDQYVKAYQIWESNIK